MNDIIFLQEQISQISAQLIKLQQSLVHHPEEMSLIISATSLQKRLDILRFEFEGTALHLGYIVCNYCILPEDTPPTLTDVANILKTFQEAVSVTYSAIVDKCPKHTMKIAKEHINATSFGWAYSYPGSLGITLTLKKEQSIFDLETSIDEAVYTVLSMMETPGVQQMAEYARNLGAAPVRALYRWSNILYNAHMGSDIEWKRNPESYRRKVIQLPTTRYICEIIQEMSDEVCETFTTKGYLEAIDHTNNRFKIVTTDGELVSGEIAESLSDQGWETKQLYKALLEVKRVVQYSTEEIKERYKLLELEQEKPLK